MPPHDFYGCGYQNKDPAVGKMADYQVILNASAWFEKGVLLEEDLAELQAKIDEKNKPVEVEEVEEVTEEGE